MGYYDKCSPVGFFIPILAVIAGVYGFNETLYEFLVSHFEPPPSCPENEAYKVCLGDCPADCSTRGACRGHFGCARKGCDCFHNFVRMTPGGACEPVHGCPEPVCGENESFRECGPVCESCTGVRCRLLQCEHRCYCKEGHLRDREGKCVSEDQCPPSPHCHRNEELRTSGRKDEYCFRDEDEASNSTTERCYCKEGFSRNMMGYCVADTLCAMTKCLSGEVYQACPKKCDATCRTYGDASCEEDGQCFPGCFCPQGMVADDFRWCVPLNECPPGSNPFAPTAGPTTTPDTSTLSSPPTTKTDASGSSPAITEDSNTTVDNTPGLATGEEDSGSTTAASTTEETTPMTSQTTSQDATETSTTSSEPKDQTEDKPKDQTEDKPKDQTEDKRKEIKPTEQAIDSPKSTKVKGKSEGSSKKTVQEDEYGGEKKKVEKATAPMDEENE